MVEALKWIVVGLAMGIAIEWFRHGSILRSLAGMPKFQADAEKLEREVAGLKTEVGALRAQAELVPGLKARVSELESRPFQVVETSDVASEVVASVVGLEAVTSLPAEFRVRLEAAGVSGLADLGSRSEQEVLDLVEAQPWDDVDVAAWISEAADLAGESTGVQSVVQPAVVDDDLMLLPGVSEAQVVALKAGGFGSFQAILGASEEALLEAVDAQPWDMVDVTAWIDIAKERS
ncbi:MAG: hypothetical protein ACKVQS_01965 [Fimbriimonadaceae bacterium]